MAHRKAARLAHLNAMSSTPPIVLRPAVVGDVEPILDLVNGLAETGVMLPRSPATVVEKLRDFVVAMDGDRLVGCGALALIWSDLAEVRSIAVDASLRGRGLGKRLAKELLDEAERMGVPRVMAFTYEVPFFEGLGFHVVEHASLPHKVFADCLNCPKFHKCDETAVVIELSAAEGAPPLGPLSLPMPGRALPILDATA